MKQLHQKKFQEKAVEINQNLQDPAHQKTLQGAFKLIRDLEIFSGRLYAVRKHFGAQEPYRLKAEDTFNHIALEVIQLQAQDKKERPYREWHARYREVWLENKGLFALTGILFLVSILVGWILTLRDPSFASAILPQETLENVLDRTKWFEELQANPLLGGLQIAWNNIRVSFNCFVLGALLGLGGITILCFNGLMVGALYAFCFKFNFDSEILQFITAHGILELTIIVASGFSGFLIGRVFFMRPRSLFRRRMRLAASEAFHVVSGILPWLLVAGLVESFVSPWPQIDYQFKLALGGLIALLFWFWTFIAVRIPASVRTNESPRSANP